MTKRFSSAGGSDKGRKPLALEQPLNMLNQSSLAPSELLNLLKGELIAVWAYLSTYVELFDHPNPKRMDLLRQAAPGFFALIQTALLETIFVRLARLMDPAATGKYTNVSFARLLQDNASSAVKLFCCAKKIWLDAKLQTFRDKVLAHNDLFTITVTNPKITTKLERQDVANLRSLFEKLWSVLAAAHIEILNTVIVEPTFGSLEMLPSHVLRQLKWAMIQANQFAPDMDHGQQSEQPNLNGFEFIGVGEEKPLRLVGKNGLG